MRNLPPAPLSRAHLRVLLPLLPPLAFTFLFVGVFATDSPSDEPAEEVTAVQPLGPGIDEAEAVLEWRAERQEERRMVALDQRLALDMENTDAVVQPGDPVEPAPEPGPQVMAARAPEPEPTAPPTAAPADPTAAPVPPPPAEAPVGTVNATVSFYYCTSSTPIGDGGGFCGTMRSGKQVYEGAAACAAAYFGQRFRIIGDPRGLTYTCEDTGSAVHGEHRDIFFWDGAEGQRWYGIVGRNVQLEILP